ncbi:DNA repair protein RecO [Rhodopirellula sp. P2]|uniref:DNA repair protein RecO n=1 Tax=Rhodopirellula sp. P2 TaxID=2127060 RepID=UPI0023681F6E|nr:DNA repair protein RecO [Rhodopirellula sp. P2]WDQ14793.1 DNA repair protein RecO [Rhodopirellula sp. P2]
MINQSTTAIVLRTVEFSETSLIVTLLTKDLGRISALAKGARRLKGPFEGSLDLLSVCAITLIGKPGDTLDLLTESKLRRRFRGAQRSLDRLHAGYYIAEMLRLLVDDDDPHGELFDMTLSAMGMIDGDGPVAETLLAFDAQCLRLLGHSPATDRCTVCGKDVERSRRRASFSLVGGGVVCETCRPAQSHLMTVSWDALGALRELARDPGGDGDGAANPATQSGEHGISEGTLSVNPSPEDPAPLPSAAFPIGRLFPSLTPAIYRDLRGLLNHTLEALIGKTPRMQAFLPSKLDSH